MKLRTYYRICLLLVPVVLAIAAISAVRIPGLSFAYWAMAYAGLQYAVFSIVAFVVIGRIKEDQNLLYIVYCAPILFLPIEFVGFALNFGSGDEHIPFRATQEFLGLAPFVLVLGYVVVITVELVRVLAQWLGVVERVGP